MGGNIKRFHFIGVAGTVMAPVAVALKHRGFEVTGSDANVYPPVSTFLEEHGIPVSSGYAATNLSGGVDLVVVGNALSRGNPEVEETLNRRLHYCSLPELVREFFLRGKKPLVVAGTHGKTTVASLLAWVLESAGLNPSFLVGGVPLNFGTGARFTDGEWFVIEGDEYDTAFFDKRSKFLHYLPDTVIINNIEFDHADIFPDVETIQAAFANLLKLVPQNGHIFVNGDDERIHLPLRQARAPLVRYGLLDHQNDILATVVQMTPEATEFKANETLFRIPLVGEFNVRNALAVVACARRCGLDDACIQRAFQSFKSAKRRMEVCGCVAGVTVVDDFAHHPTAIAETIKALRVRYPASRIWVAFEPRSNTTRRRVFQAELTHALGMADVVTVGAVARANLLAESDRLDISALQAELAHIGKTAFQFDRSSEIASHYAERAQVNDVFCIMTNGSFDGLSRKVIAELGRREAATHKDR